MFALMCGCCCDKKPQNFTFFGIICFFSAYVVDNRKYGFDTRTPFVIATAGAALNVCLNALLLNSIAVRLPRARWTEEA